MKIRMAGNSLRLRLLRSEVQRLAEQGVVEESVDFGAGRSLRYRLQAGGSVLAAVFEGSSIDVFLPEEAARTWAQTDQVSLSGRQGPLQILIEKDFSCLHTRSDGDQEDQHDNFPHPRDCAGQN